MTYRSHHATFSSHALGSSFDRGFGQPVGLGRSFTVGEGEAAVRFRHGRQEAVVGPGRHRVTRIGTTVRFVGLRTRFTTLPLQEVPTADGVTVRVSVAVLSRVTEPEAYVAAGDEVEQVTYLAVQVALRELVAALPYDQLLAQRAELAERLLAGVGDLGSLGLVVERVEVKDLVLPTELRKAQAAVLMARAEGQVALERARGETAALRSLANAARLAADNPALMQLRLIQQLESSTGHTVVLANGTVG